mgnify:CR=1 FL=1
MAKLPDKELLRVEEVSEYLNISKSTVYLYIDHGHLEAEKLGGCIRILRESVINFRLASKLRPLD